jgi:branched-chain amino acid transport system substrate-binding protein
VVALGVAAAGCGGEEAAAPAPPPAEPAPAEPPPAETPPAEPPPAEEPPPAPAECPFEGGVIRAYSTQDLSAVIGEEIGPAGKRAADVWAENVNAGGGILGCQVEITIDDDAFDIPTCLRLYRDAIASKKYNFFFGPTNSGCMLSLGDLTSAAGQILISGIAADHQPFLEKFQPYNFHASVSTFLEGRASAVFAQEQGWKNVATIVPNYAYGQDAEKGFREYYLQIVPDGQVVERQFPEFDEDNFTPFINAMVGKNPDGVFSAFFGPFIVPFWKQWKAGGNEDIPTISGLNILATFDAVAGEGDIPANTYGYNRADWQILGQTPVGKELSDLYQATYGSDHPITSEFAFQIFSALQLAKGLIEKTQSLDPDDWVAEVESGNFTYDSPYHAGPTPVNPINHMADTCAEVGHVVWNPDLPIPPSYDPASFVVSCMHDVLPQDEAQSLTARSDAPSADALAAYDAAVEAVKEADAAIGLNP